ncbi:hypothetical protein vseg_020230 [Gypsophila vaccaria]
MANWADIHPDILSQILKRIKNPSDHIRSSAVCSSWRSVALHHRYTLPHSTPGLMVSPKHSLHRNLINFQNNSPPFHYHHRDHDHDLDVSCHDTCCGSYQGWLLLISHDHSSICLHNPFLKRRRLLPTLGRKKVYKGILSSSPSYDTKCVVLVLFQSKGAAFCYAGDGSWKNVACQDYNIVFSDALFFEGRVHLVDDYGKIYLLNVNDTTLESIESQPSDVSETVRHKFYLVEVQGQLCRVQRKFTYDESFYYKCDITNDECDAQVGCRVSTREFRVLRMDTGRNEWVRVNNLGEHALFLGCNNSICVSEVELSEIVKGNKVYFTDDRQKNTKHFGMDNPGRDMGIFDMTDMSIEPVYSDPWYELMDDPNAVWVTPLPW